MAASKEKQKPVEVKQQRLFDIDEYKTKVLGALEKLKTSQQPGERTGKGSKTIVLQAAKKEIIELIEKGYTSKQISDAITEDVFGILPKTITQLANVKKEAPAKPRKKRTPATTPPAIEETPNEPKIPAQKITKIEEDVE